MTKEQLKQLEADLWSAADNLRANSDLKSSEYATPVLGLIFLRFADNNYRRHEAEINAEFRALQDTRREKKISDIAIEKCGFYLPNHARYEYLLRLPEENDIAKALKEAMKAIEEYKPELDGVLPKDEYFRLTRDEKTKDIPNQLLKTFANIPADVSGDLFGQIYEYFLTEFARSEGSKGGEFFTPRSVVRLMAELIEPHGGKVFDPACGSGGMFVQSGHFIDEHRREFTNQDGNVYFYGQEKTLETVNLAKMNLAVNGLRGEIKKANAYYDDPFDSFGSFDYVLANPPFNVDDVSLKEVEGDKRFSTYGIPRKKAKARKKDQGKETVPNANYLWINLFATSLKPKGRAALVMANSASDARHSEANIRRNLIEKNLIYAMLTLPSNMFYTVTLPATLWFFDKAKIDNNILFIDARNVFTTIDRAHREFSEEQILNISIINQLHKGQRSKFVQLVDHYFSVCVDRLVESALRVAPISAQIREVLDDDAGKRAVDVVAMATRNAARILKWDKVAGGIEVGKRADLLVIGSTVADPYDALIRAKETDIRLVMINGIARYGVPDVMKPLVPDDQTVRVGGQLRRLFLRQETTDPDVGQVPLKTATTRLRKAFRDIAKLAKDMERPRRTRRRVLDARAAPVWSLALDEICSCGVELSPRLPFDGPRDFTGPERAPRTRTSSVPLSAILKPVELDPLTVADDGKFLEKIAQQPNLQAPLKTGLQGLF